MRLIGWLLLSQLSGVAAAANPAAGKFWYEQNCARCHGSPPQERQAGTPNITGVSASRIATALRSVPAMVKVNLSDAQILDVESYLQRPQDYAWAPTTNFTDLWWNPAESGWGLSLTQRPNSRLVGFLYLYDSGGQPLWLMCSDMQWQDPWTVTGQLLRSSAAGFPVASFDPERVALRSVGTVTLRFGDASRGTVEFTIDGSAYSKPIERLAF